MVPDGTVLQGSFKEEKAGLLRNPKAPTLWQHWSCDKVSAAPSCVPEQQGAQFLQQATRHASSHTETSCVRTSVHTQRGREKSLLYERLSSGSSPAQKHHLSSQSMPGAAEPLLREQTVALVQHPDTFVYAQEEPLEKWP